MSDSNISRFSRVKIIAASIFFFLEYAHSANRLDCPGPACPASTDRQESHSFRWRWQGLNHDMAPTNKNSNIRSRIDPTNPNGSIGKDLHSKFTLCNKTDWKIPYSINGTRDLLSEKECKEWTIRGQVTMGFNTGAIGDKFYILNNGNYSFQKFNFDSPNTLHPTFYVDLRKD